MKHKNILMLLCLSAVITALFTSCSEDNNPVKPVPLDTTTFTYPMKDGNYWKYNFTLSYTDCHPDTIKKYLPDIHGFGKVTVLYDTLINSVNTKCFLEEFTQDTNYRESRNYYINTDTALLLYAHRGFISQYMPQLDDKGSFSIYNPPIKVLVYPVTTNRQWNNNPGETGYRKYLGFENVVTSAGTISCMKTVKSYTVFINPEEPYTLDYYNYYSAKGYVREHVFMNDIDITIVGFPEGLGTVDITGETILTEYSVNP